MTKKLVFIALSIMMAAVASAQAHEVDRCGVIKRLDAPRSIMLVFTGHYSPEDNGYTENFDGIETVLDVLKEKNVKASFFPTGITMAQPRYDKSIRRIIDEGHYLSGHSYAHLLLYDGKKSLVTRDTVAADLRLMEQQLERYGLDRQDYNIMMPPYETTSVETARYYLDEGYTLICPTDGIISNMDWTRPGTPAYRSASDILEQLWQYEKAHGLDGVILLIHAMNYPWRTPDDRPYNYLPQIIDHLRSQGYTFTLFQED